MPYVVQESCTNCKYADCVGVCPVECFYEGPDMLYINPEECVDCNACVPVCPVNAIFADYDADEKWIVINAKFGFEENKRRITKEEVTHGPGFDPAKATS